MAQILITDSLGPAGIALLEEAGHRVDLLAAEDRPKLAELLGDYDSVIVRSGTRLDRDLLAAGTKLRVVGRAGIGVDNIDIQAATERGILVVNAPTANSMSATEHTFAMLLSLARNVPSADRSMKSGDWDRKAFVGNELYGKTLGIIGFGQIGQRVAARARGFEMEVAAFDPFINAEVARSLDVEPMELDDMLPRADFISFHTPLTDGTRNLLDAERIASLKPGAVVVNCGRGGVLDEAALLEAIESGHVAGAALDVFASEPPEDFALAQHPNVVATPHIGASTREAQERIAVETARMVSAALEGSLAVSAVNLPFRGSGTRGEPFLRLAEQLGRLGASCLGGAPSRLEVALWGVEEALETPVSVAAVKGALTPALGAGVNYVNAGAIANDRGLEVVRASHSEPADYSHLIEVSVSSDVGDISVAGTIYGRGELRVVRLSGFPLEFEPSGLLLILRNNDIPGVIGRFGTIIGDAGINIADIHLARQGDDAALAVLRLDQSPSDALLEQLLGLPEVTSAVVVSLD